MGKSQPGNIQRRAGIVFCDSSEVSWAESSAEA